MNDSPATDSEQHRPRTLFGVVRARRVTCRWCADPTMGFTGCRRCTGHHRTAGVADVIAPLVYAIAGTESAALLRDYKNHPSGAVRRQCADELTALVTTAISRHEDCVAAKVGIPITVRTTIPSLTLRPGIHPFSSVVRAAGVPISDVLEPGPLATCHRTVSAGKFAVLARAVAGRHVLILDDIWTTGSNAQSAALVLRAAGAAAVSVMPVGRWLNPDYPPTKTFIDRYLHARFDPRRCPLSARGCAHTLGSTAQ